MLTLSSGPPSCHTPSPWTGGPEAVLKSGVVGSYNSVMKDPAQEQDHPLPGEDAAWRGAGHRGWREDCLLQVPLLLSVKYL